MFVSIALALAVFGGRHLETVQTHVNAFGTPDIKVVHVAQKFPYILNPETSMQPTALDLDQRLSAQRMRRMSHTLLIAPHGALAEFIIDQQRRGVYFWGASGGTLFWSQNYNLFGPIFIRDKIIAIIGVHFNTQINHIFECSTENGACTIVHSTPQAIGRIYFDSGRYLLLSTFPGQPRGFWFEVSRLENGAVQTLFARYLTLSPTALGNISKFNEFLFFGIIAPDLFAHQPQDIDPHNPSGDTTLPDSLYGFAVFSLNNRRFSALREAISFPALPRVTGGTYSIISDVSFESDGYFLSRTSNQFGYLWCKFDEQCTQYQFENLRWQRVAQPFRHDISRVFRLNNRHFFGIANNHRFRIVWFDPESQSLGTDVEFNTITSLMQVELIIEGARHE